MFFSIQVLQARRKELKSKGLGNKPNKADNLTQADEDKLWESDQLGLNTPTALLNTVWFNNTKLFGFRGCDENRQLKWGDVTLKNDTEGTTYLEFNERSTKTRDGNSCDRAYAPKIFANKQNPEKCPIEAYKLYKAERPTSMNQPDAPFYLAINGNYLAKPTSLWLKSQPVGINKLSSMMKNMASAAGLSGKKTNHSLRKTACTTLLHANVPPTLGTQFSGHKNLASFSNYATASFAQQREMSHILQDCAPKSQNSLAICKRKIINQSPNKTAPAPKTVRRTAESSMTENLASGLFSGANISGGTFNISFQINSQKNKNSPDKALAISGSADD